MSGAVLKRLMERFGDAVVATHDACGDETAVVERSRLHELALWLRDDPTNRFDLFRDVTAVDRLLLPDSAPRFEVVYHLYSIPERHAIRLKVRVDEDDPHVPTLSDVWPAANWGEREVWDMYGIVFDDHPDLRRILLYEEFEGHPLRKDYDKRASQPRLDLIAPERDAIAEYHRWDERRRKVTGDEAS